MASHRCVLRFIGGKYETAEFPVTDTPIRIGRNPDLDMVLFDEAVSDEHARIVVDGNTIWLEDLDSASGTYVNNQRIKRVALKLDDCIVIGTHTMTVMAESS
jgi:pSer/pThr/pTyr-binding forkhead associated (FHA) protein